MAFGVNELREKYLQFFESKGHLRLPSFSLVPQNDKSLLLVSAGMAPLKPWFSGHAAPPSPRVTTCQKCIRTPDIERVGKTSRHGTFFEMLGNFSFGDYFKREAIEWAWEFLTQIVGLPEEKLFITVHTDDDEAYDIWTKEMKLPQTHVSRLEDNFWEIGAGPCGPDSELHYDRGEKYGCGDPACAPGCDCDRFIEVWNLVFTQFDNDGEGNYTPLSKKNIDTGMGLERLACIVQGVDTMFEVDTIHSIMEHVSRVAKKSYGASEKTDVSLRIITDHIRSTVMMAGDGIVPSNEGRGYVMRRLLRRAARHGRLLGISGPFLCEVCKSVIDNSGEAYPELRERSEAITKVIRAEEDRFAKTIDAGLAILGEKIAAARKNGGVLPGAEAFLLYDTFGFPIDLTLEVLEEEKLGVDMDGFEALMNEQRQRARAARTAEGDFGWAGDESIDYGGETVFTGYESDSEETKIALIAADGERREEISAGDKAALLLERSPFYAESGGQAGDTGEITGAKGAVFSVSDTKMTEDGHRLHIGRVVSGAFAEGDSVEARIDSARRAAIRRAHSATHLLQKALVETLGAHVAQAGSLVEPDRLRFDFSHFEGMKAEELDAVEAAVNGKILEGLAVSCAEMSVDEAKAAGATALFGEKYGERVRVVSMGGYSMELCGGTHLDNTAKAGLFRIVSESSVAAGVRRIEGVTGPAVLELEKQGERLIEEAAGILKTTPGDILRRSAQVMGELKELHKKIDGFAVLSARAAFEQGLKEAKTVACVPVAAVRLDGASADTARKLGDDVKSREEPLVAVLAAVEGGRLTFVAAASKGAVDKGVHAGNLVREVAKLTGGNGGGRADSAAAGGKDVSKIDEALASVAGLAGKMLGEGGK